MPITEFLVSIIKLSRFSNLLLGIAIFMLIPICIYVEGQQWKLQMKFHFKYARDGFQEVRDKEMGRRGLSSLTSILWAGHKIRSLSTTLTYKG